MSTGPQRKIPKLVQKYGLQDVDKKMVTQWTHPDEDERWTLKQIKNWFNQLVLRSAMVEEGIDPAAGEVEYGYMYLIGNPSEDDFNQSERQDFIDRLRSRGVDVDEVVSDFINSNTTFYNYLSDNKGALHPSKSDKDRSNGKSFSRDAMITRFQRMKARYEQVSEDAVQTLVNNGEIPEIEIETSVDFNVEFPETGETVYLEELLLGEADVVVIEE